MMFKSLIFTRFDVKSYEHRKKKIIRFSHGHIDHIIYRKKNLKKSEKMWKKSGKYDKYV